jgi:hypothetical protein
LEQTHGFVDPTTKQVPTSKSLHDGSVRPVSTNSGEKVDDLFKELTRTQRPHDASRDRGGEPGAGARLHVLVDT